MAAPQPLATLESNFEGWLANGPAIDTAAYAMMFGGKLRMGTGRGIFWRHALGVLPAPPKSVLKALAGRTSSDSDSSSSSAASSDDESDESDDTLLGFYKRAAEKARAEFADWVEEQKTKVIPTKPESGSPSTKASAAKAGPRFGDDSDSDSGGFEAASSPAAGGDNPLDSDTKSRWGQYFARQKVLELVDKDLGRLWGGDEFFEDPALRADMRQVLECLLDRGIVSDYCQGMHELLSLLMLVLSEDADAAADLPVTARHAGCLKALCSARYIKHDAYVLLRVMLTSRDGGMGLAQWYEADPDFDDLDRPVVAVSDRIQNVLLAKADPELAAHLKKLEITPASYGLRWLRLLFLREFPFGQVATMWDAIFANHAAQGRKPLHDALMVHLSVAMLILVRADLLDTDYGLVLRRLMRYPPVEGVSNIIQRAAIAAYGSNSRVAAHCGAAPSLLRSAETAAAAAASAGNRPRSGTAFQQAPAAADQGTRSPSPPQNQEYMPPSLVADNSPKMAPKAASPTSSWPTGGPTPRELAVGEALGRVVSTMGDKWFPGSGGVPPPDADPEYIMAIAELKRLRDVLMNGLPLE